MKFLRTHIARLTVIVWLSTGLGLFLVQNVQANQSSHEFAQWLSSMAETSKAVDLEKELNDLKESTDRLDELIAKASQIVSKNNEEFKFPIANSTASQQIFQLLFFEWTQLQTENAMAAVPTNSSVKPFVSINIDKLMVIGGAPEEPEHSNKKYASVHTAVDSKLVTTVSATPMSSGIAIHAP